MTVQESEDQVEGINYITSLRTHFLSPPPPRTTVVLYKTGVGV